MEEADISSSLCTFHLFICFCVWFGDSLSLCPYLSVWSAQMTGTNRMSLSRELKEKLVRHIHSFIKTIMRLLIGALTGKKISNLHTKTVLKCFLIFLILMSIFSFTGLTQH